MEQTEGQTAAVVEEMYRAYLAGDGEAMLGLFDDNIEVRFLGQVSLEGIAAAREFFAFSAALLTDIEFTVEHKIVDGEWAAVVWSERARTVKGQDWDNHGVDVVRVLEGKVVVLHENNDCRKVFEHFPRYEPHTG